VSTEEVILDLGTFNPFTSLMKSEGFTVYNTSGEDLDVDTKRINNISVDCYTSFELFEHLVCPYNILKEIKEGKLITSVPLKVWFAKAYWNKSDQWDRHYHEFEPRQFDWLLKKSGWKIYHSEKWRSPDRLRFGIRPLLRFFWPSYYFVYAEKNLV
jgi:hypothetical protein